MKILVVDDDATCRLILRTILARFGQVDCCEDGAEAITAFRRALDSGEGYEVICLDVMMPNMNGIEALEIIRQEEEHTGSKGHKASKIIITTALNDRGTIDDAFTGLCDAYLVKPVKPGDLINLLFCLCPDEQWDVSAPPTSSSSITQTDF